MTAVANLCFGCDNRRRVFTIKDLADINPYVRCGEVMQMTALDENGRPIELEFKVTRNELFLCGTRWIYGALNVPQGTVQVEIKLAKTFNTLELFPFAPAIL